MTRIDVSDPKSLRAAVDKYLADFPGELICALQLWYEGLGGQGVPNASEMAAIQDAIAGTSGWADISRIRYEKYGMQQSWKRTSGKPDTATKAMIQHSFKRDGLYKEPNGKVLKVITCELWNLRCFEVADGNLTGPMIKIHPESDRAKALVEVI